MKKFIIKFGTAAAIGTLSWQLLVAGAFALSPRATPEGLLRRPASLRNVKVEILGTLSAKNGNALTVTRDSKSYSVLINANTQLRRQFWGKATLDEMLVGDSVNVVGKWTDDVQSAIQARTVRDLSIQKRFGVFFGTVSSLSANGWVMTTVNRGNQTVTVSSSTKFVNRKEQTITQAEVKVNDKVRVRGLWDNKLNTITEVSKVKNFSLPKN